MRVAQHRLDTLWEHLVLLEELTGMPLRSEPRGRGTACPIYNFAPNNDADGNEHWLISHYGPTYHNLDDDEDAFWFSGLADSTKIQINKWVQNKIRGLV